MRWTTWFRCLTWKTKSNSRSTLIFFRNNLTFLPWIKTILPILNEGSMTGHVPNWLITQRPFKQTLVGKKSDHRPQFGFLSFKWGAYDYWISGLNTYIAGKIPWPEDNWCHRIINQKQENIYFKQYRINKNINLGRPLNGLVCSGRVTFILN